MSEGVFEPRQQSVNFVRATASTSYLHDVDAQQQTVLVSEHHFFQP